VAALVAVVVGVSRMYDGFHHPSDVVAGTINGTSWLLLTWLVLRPLRPDPAMLLRTAPTGQPIAG